eukprot:4629097-Heterocapsa_arctica.AAC.1
MELGFVEMKLLNAVFVLRHPCGRVRALALIHVDDTRMTGDDSSEEIWATLRKRFTYGSWHRADEQIKFCGRWEQQMPDGLSRWT